MKIRNAIIALGLAMVLSFGFAAPVSAHTVTNTGLQSEDGMLGVIDDLLLDNNMLVLQLNTENVLNLSLVSPSGATVWATKTNASSVTIPVQQFAGGTYTLIVIDNGKAFYYTVQLPNGQSLAGGSTI